MSKRRRGEGNQTVTRNDSLHDSFKDIDVTTYARDLLHKLKINSLPIDPKNIAEQLGIIVDEKPFKQAIDGLFIRLGDQELIAVNAEVKNENRKRFTYAHELGHARIPWHGNKEYRCKYADVTGNLNKDLKEKEANAFAAELMMPRQFFQKDVDRLELSFSVLDELATNKYGTSLTATALRFVDLTIEPCAVVLTESGKVVWGKRSVSFHNRIRVGCDVSENTYAYDFFRKGVNLDGRQETVLASAWVETSNPDKTLIESSRSFSDLGIVLTLLMYPTQSL